MTCSVFQDDHADLSNVPREYLDLKGVFSKSLAASLPPLHPYDCAIDLSPGTYQGQVIFAFHSGKRGYGEIYF